MNTLEKFKFLRKERLCLHNLDIFVWYLFNVLTVYILNSEYLYKSALLYFNSLFNSRISDHFQIIPDCLYFGPFQYSVKIYYNNLFFDSLIFYYFQTVIFGTISGHFKIIFVIFVNVLMVKN